MSPWILLAAAVVAEVVATVALRFSAGMTRPGPAVAVVVGYATAFWLLSRIVQSLPASVTYAVWAGAGVALVSIVGVLLLGESMSGPKALSLRLIVVGVVGLNVSGGAHAQDAGAAAPPTGRPATAGPA